MAKLSRREFISLTAAAAAGTALAPLGRLYAHNAGQQYGDYPVSGMCLANGASEGFGALSPKLPLNAAELTATVAGDLSQTALLELPPGFSYTALSITGQMMDDGMLVPGAHDGMACFRGHRNTLVLVRNHELSAGSNIFGNHAGCLPPNGKVYDPFNIPAGQGGGGTTTLVVSQRGELLHQHISLGGTIRNCAGGLTPWGSWLTCEENTSTPANNGAASKKHGYVFEVPAHYDQAVDPIPLVGMGRCNHEAVAVDPHSGDVYLTEDSGDSCFYRYVPHDRRPNRYGDLQKGGKLYTMVIDASAAAVCDGSPLPVTGSSVDVRSGVQSFLGQPLKVRWARIEEPDPEQDTLRQEAQSKGAAIIARGEGCWYGDGLIYFISTSGGDIGNGQVWAYDPRRETVTLIVESTDGGVLDNPDNITVAPDGTLYLCEDGGGEQFVVGVDDDGDLFKFARNNFNTSEFAGACFSPDGTMLFVNMQSFGVTYAIFRDNHRPISLARGGRGKPRWRYKDGSWRG